MINNKLLAGTLALVLVAGLGTPALAQIAGPTVSGTSQVLTPQHGPVDQSFTGPFNNAPFVGPNLANTGHGQTFIPTQTFLLGVDVFSGDFFGGGSDTITVSVWDGSAPGTGNLLGSASATLDVTGATIGNPAVFHVNFVPTIILVPGNTYSLQFGGLFGPTSGQGSVLFASSINPYAGGVLFQNGNSFANFDFGFVTYFSDKYVGGDMLPIDSTALMLAGLQSSAIWMLPALAGIAGVGAYFIRTRMTKE